jgi:hypothetical protein
MLSLNGLFGYSREDFKIVIVIDLFTTIGIGRWIYCCPPTTLYVWPEKGHQSFQCLEDLCFILPSLYLILNIHIRAQINCFFGGEWKKCITKLCFKAEKKIRHLSHCFLLTWKLLLDAFPQGDPRRESWASGSSYMK